MDSAQYKIKGRVRNIHPTWYRGEHCNFFPNKKALLEDEEAIKKHILQGWTPETPFIDKNTPICAFGSCFATHITEYFSWRGYNILTADTKAGRYSYIVTLGEGMVSTPVILQQFEWAFDNKTFDEALWFDQNKTLAEYNEQIRTETLDIFNKSDVFILTLGLSEVWYNTQNGDAFWRAIPQDHFDPQKHGFKVLEPHENYDNLARIYALIRKHRGDNAKIILTLSPIPLTATFRPTSCVTANSVSKASLRCSIDRLVREKSDDPNLFYFPSYEIVTEYFKDPYIKNNRYLKPQVIKTIMGQFEQSFCTAYEENIEQDFPVTKRQPAP